MASKENGVKFEKKYPHAVKPPTIMGPHKEIWVTETLGQTWRLYPCSMCKELTGWREVSQGCSINICSEECLLALAQQMAEMQLEEQEEKLDAESKPAA